MGPADKVEGERMAWLGTSVLGGGRRTVDTDEPGGWEKASRRVESRSANSRSYSRKVSRLISEMLEERRYRVFSPRNCASMTDLGDSGAAKAEWASVESHSGKSVPYHSHFADGANMIKWSYCGSPNLTSCADSSFGPLKVSW
jgi:hypothetical protein